MSNQEKQQLKRLMKYPVIFMALITVPSLATIFLVLKGNPLGALMGFLSGIVIYIGMIYSSTWRFVVLPMALVNFVIVPSGSWIALRLGTGREDLIFFSYMALLCCFYAWTGYKAFKKSERLYQIIEEKPEITDKD